MRRHGVSHIVAATTLGRGAPWEGRAGDATGSIRRVDLLRGTGAAVRGLAPPAFMDNALRQAGTIRQGKMCGPIDPDKTLPHTATRDTGAVAAGLLLDRAWPRQEDAPVLGPEELSYRQLAAIISQVIGWEVCYEHRSYDAYKAEAVARGLTDAFAQGFVDMLRAKEEGMDNVASRTAAIMGPTSFRTWAEQALKPALAR